MGCKPSKQSQVAAGNMVSSGNLRKEQFSNVLETVTSEMDSPDKYFSSRKDEEIVEEEEVVAMVEDEKTEEEEDEGKCSYKLPSSLKIFFFFFPYLWTMRLIQ